MKRCSGWAKRCWFLGSAVLLLACGGKSTSPEDDEAENACVGDYAGAYTGDVSGSLTGKLERSGRFSVSFASQSLPTSITGSGTLDENGKILVTIQSNRITGALNEARCSAAGDWQFGDAARGTWQMKKR